MNPILAKYVPMTETGCYILLSIADTPKHGYAIVQYVKAITNERITLGNGTLYGTISKMEKDELIRMILDDDKKKTYEITELGRQVLHNEKERIAQLHHILKEVD